MRKIWESPSLVELQLIASYLENEGVAVVILNEHQGGNPGVPHWGLSVWAELWIKDSNQFEKAAKLMGRYQDVQSQGSTDEWICSECKEANPDTFDTCWNCGGTSSVAT